MNASVKLTRRSTSSLASARVHSPNGRRGRLRRWGIGLVLGVLALPLGSGCNDHPVGGGDGPEFRGITVPLPPPSFRSATVVDVELAGSARGFEGGRASAWNTEESQGIVGLIDAAGQFKFKAWKLRLDKHCVELRAARDFQAPSGARFYALDLYSGQACSANTCSAMDSKGDCVCLVQYAGNCVNRRETAAPGANPGTQANSGSGSGSTR